MCCYNILHEIFFLVVLIVDVFRQAESPPSMVSDVGRTITGEETHALGNLPQLGGTTHWKASLSRGVKIAERAGEIGCEQSRCDGVHHDATMRDLNSQDQQQPAAVQTS